MPYMPSIYIIRKLASEWVINHRNVGLYKWQDVYLLMNYIGLTYKTNKAKK